MSLLVAPTTARRIGAVTLGLLALAIGFVVFVLDRLEWGHHIRIHVLLQATGGLREGAPLVIAGRTIGEVESIALTGEHDGGVDVVVALPMREANRVPRGGDIFIASRGALGARYLEIGAAPDAAVGTHLLDGDRIVGRDPPSLDRVLQRTWDNLSTAREFAEAVRPEAHRLAANLEELAATLGSLAPDAASSLALRVDLLRLVAEARQLRELGLGGDAGLAKAAAVIAHAQTTLALGRDVLAGLVAHLDTLAASARTARARLAAARPELVASLDQIIERAHAIDLVLVPMLAKVDEIRGRIERGEGSLLRLSRDPEFPEDAKELGKIMKRQPWTILNKPGD